MKMKRVISAILCAVMIFGCTASTATAAKKDNIPAFEWDGNPVIFIQGYSGPILIRDRGLETEEEVWGINAGDLIKKLIPNLYGIVSSLAKYADGDPQPFIEQFREISAELIDDISMMPDGSSKYNIVSFPCVVEEASIAYIREELKGKGTPFFQDDFIDAMAQTVPEEYIYVFNTDWRRSQIDNSAHLAEFIDSVLEETGADKVDIFSMSHGGQLTATYLYYYGTEGKVDNAVLNSPATGGTTLVTELLGAEPINFNMEELLRFACVMLNIELDLRWLGRLLPGEFLNSLVKTAFNEVLLPHAIYFGSVWDFMDIETYTRLRDVYLDPVENADIIEKADKLHYDCMANIGEGLRRAQAAGVNIHIISNYGTQLGTGKKIDSDFIINTTHTCGANASVYGETLGKEYVQKSTVCKDASHDHVAPTGTVDASTCYLPENTWFVYEQYHTQTWYDPYTRCLILELLLTDNIADVHSDSRYPQFELSQNPLDGVYARFTDSKTGEYGALSDEMLIKSLTDNYSLNILSVKINGVEQDTDEKLVIRKNGEITVPCKIPEGANRLKVEIRYERKNDILSNPFVRTIYFECKD
ncbi:MAG: hypothetical protein IKC20_05510 [Clostridia bacterium]|nr:hypothetical protein [Clostridia bacterium]